MEIASHHVMIVTLKLVGRHVNAMTTLSSAVK